jgi:hypothetical protein
MLTSIKALKDLIATLQKLLPGMVVGTMRPKTVSDLPRVTVSSLNIKERAVDIGGETVTANNLLTGTFRAIFALMIDITAESDVKVEEISEKLMQALFDERINLARAGFIRLSVSGIGEIIPDNIGPTDKAISEIWKRRLEYECIYEQVITGEIKAQPAIKRDTTIINSKITRPRA